MQQQITLYFSKTHISCQGEERGIMMKLRIRQTDVYSSFTAVKGGRAVTRYGGAGLCKSSGLLLVDDEGEYVAVYNGRR